MRNPSILARALARLGEWVLSHRALAGVLVVLLVGSLAAFIPRVQFDNSPDAFFLKGDPTLEDYQRFKDLFQTDEYSLIVLDAPARWTPQVVSALQDLTNRLARLDHVVDVTAITNVRYIRGNEFALDVADFLPGGTAAGLDEGALSGKRAAALEHPYYAGLYVSEDGSRFGVVVETEIVAGEIEYKIALAEQIRALLAEEPYASWNAVAVGAPILDADVRSIVSTESGIFGAAAFALVSIGFLLVFRSLYGLILPFSVALLSIVSAFGIMGLIGAPVTLLTPIVPSFLISVGIGSSIFLATSFANARRERLEPAAAVVQALEDAGPASVLAALTTAAALLAFSSSEIRPVMEVGIVMGLSLLVALLLTLVLVPAILGRRARGPASPGHESGAALERAMSRRLSVLQSVAGFAIRNPGRILVAFVVVIGFAAVGIAELRTDYYYLGNFKQETRIRSDYATVDAALPASSAIEVLIRADELDGWKEPGMLERLSELQAAIANGADIPTKSYSLADVVKEINQAIHDGDPHDYRIPDSRAAVAQSLLLFESSGHDELSNLASPDYDVARLTVRVPTMADTEYRQVMTLIESHAARLFGASAAPGDARLASVTVTGLVPMWTRIADYLTQSQVRALTISFVVITIVMMVVFRSVALGLTMSCVNASVVALVLGVMGWTATSLDPYTILIAAIALGILDDDTMHFVKSTQAALERGAGVAEAIRAAYASAGQGMMYTTTVLVLSFSAYAFSQVASLSKFGLLVSLTLLLGLLVEFLVTPAVLLVLSRAGLLQSSADGVALPREKSARPG